jgi:hypothetical protein
MKACSNRVVAGIKAFHGEKRKDSFSQNSSSGPDCYALDPQKTAVVTPSVTGQAFEKERLIEICYGVTL